MASAAMDRGAPLRVTGAWIPTLMVLWLTPSRVAPGADGRVPLVVEPAAVLPPALGAAVPTEPAAAPGAGVAARAAAGGDRIPRGARMVRGRPPLPLFRPGRAGRASMPARGHAAPVVLGLGMGGRGAGPGAAGGSGRGAVGSLRARRNVRARSPARGRPDA